MRKPTLKQLEKCETMEDLEALNIGQVVGDICPRGGGLGFYRQDIARMFKMHEVDFPRFFGAGCNYLGGGVRGSIFPSGYNRDSAPDDKTRALLDAIQAACVRVYEAAEGSLNDDTDADGEPNWDGQATKAARAQRARVHARFTKGAAMRQRGRSASIGRLLSMGSAGTLGAAF